MTRYTGWLAITAAALAFAPAATMADPLAADPDAQHPALVTTGWVEANLDDPSLRVLEVSVIPGVFERGHIPGAVNIVWHTDLVDPVRRDIVGEDGFEALLSRAGISPDTTVVLYGDNNNWFAAWGAWIFEIYGVEDVRLLDGGRVKWELESRPLSGQPATHAATTYDVSPVNLHVRARLADVLDVVEGEVDATLLDIRSPDEYSGRIFAPQGSQELSIRAGHVPGALNIPWSQAVNTADGTFKPLDELRALYGAEGIDGSEPVIVYCRIGERSSHSWFVLSRLLGYDARQYDGSWTEYGNAVGVPIENPAGTVWGAL